MKQIRDSLQPIYVSVVLCAYSRHKRPRKQTNKKQIATLLPALAARTTLAQVRLPTLQNLHSTED